MTSERGTTVATKITTKAVADFFGVPETLAERRIATVVR
jgi:hypothetical protein